MPNKSVPTDIPLIIDAHAHLGSFRNFHIPQSDAGGLISAMDRYGIDMSVLASHAAISSDFRRGNDESLAAADAFPSRLFVHCCINPNYPSLADSELTRCFQHPAVRGIKLHPELHGDYPLDGPGYRPVWEYADEHGLPVLSHSYFAGDSLAVFERMATNYPRATVILGHAGLSFGLEAVANLVAEHDNVAVDLCGALTNDGVVEVLVARMGASRLLFGTDMPFINAASTLGTLLYARLDPAKRALIAGQNAARLFGLPTTAVVQ
jgi:predicted TIM-barrel fold metal-dependent hydrolase